MTAPAVPGGMKRCTKCGEIKPVSEFHRNKSRKDGLQEWCKACKAKRAYKYRDRNREKVIEYKRKYREINREKANEYQRKYIERNPEQTHKYYACVKRPSCPLVGGRGAKFIIFTCETCGMEFRRLKSDVDWQYEHDGRIPRFCSLSCRYAAMRKNYKSPYAKKIEDIKKRLKN